MNEFQLPKIIRVMDIVDKNELEETKKTPNGISKQLSVHIPENFQNTTVIDLSNKNLAEIDENVALPPCLRSINLSHNKLRKVPKIVFNLKNLQVLDISHNRIEFFNETPSFCHAIENLNLSNNDLKSPPLWIWFESARNLTKLNISCNVHITELLQGHIDELLQYNIQVTHVILYNCRLGKHLRFLGTFLKAKELELGTSEWSCYAANHLQELPGLGLNNFCDIQRLILTNTHIYTVTSGIKLFKNLIEINLSQNNINSLPTEFCELENLEICILSFNNILYVPDDIHKLKKLTTLCLAVNELCMIPENITELANLRILDLYDNHISEFPEGIKNIPEIDLARNYFDEPDDEDYLGKREKFRLQYPDRQSGRKIEIEHPESVHSPDTPTTDDEELSIKDGDSAGTEPRNEPSSPEDWDSDSYWEPHSMEFKPPRGSAYWLSFAKEAMNNGNLCPMDNHIVPVMEMVKYEKMCYPTQEYESDGQFDDCSEDDS